MKKALFAATALSFAATVAYAQTDAGPPSPPKPPAAGGPAATPPPPGPESTGRPDDMHGPGGMHGPGRHGPGGWMKHHMMMMSKGARIRVSDGDIHVNVKCAEGDSTAECGQIVIRILKQMQTDQGTDEDQNGADQQGGDDPTMNE